MLNFLKHIISDRKKQLKLQKNIDNIILESRVKCPQTLIDFFIVERVFNREQCFDVNNSNIWEYPDIISKNMEILEKRNNKLLLELESNNVCSVLKKYNQEQK